MMLLYWLVVMLIGSEAREGNPSKRIVRVLRSRSLKMKYVGEHAKKIGMFNSVLGLEVPGSLFRSDWWENLGGESESSKSSKTKTGKKTQSKKSLKSIFEKSSKKGSSHSASKKYKRSDAPRPTSAPSSFAFDTIGTEVPTLSIAITQLPTPPVLSPTGLPTTQVVAVTPSEPPTSRPTPNPTEIPTITAVTLAPTTLPVTPSPTLIPSAAPTPSTPDPTSLAPTSPATTLAPTGQSTNLDVTTPPTELPTDNPTAATTTTPPTNVPTPSTTNSDPFDITFTFVDTAANDETLIRQSASRWESVISSGEEAVSGIGLTSIFAFAQAGCTYPDEIDDLHLCSGMFDEVSDGAGGALAVAGAERTRPNGVPFTGLMAFDPADQSSLDTLTVLHEMGHGTNGLSLVNNLYLSIACSRSYSSR